MSTLDLITRETAALCGLIDYRRRVRLGLDRAAPGHANCYGEAWPLLGRVTFNQAHPWADYDEHGRRWRILHELAHLCAPFLRCGTADQHEEGFCLTFAALQLRAFGRWELTGYELGGLRVLDDDEAAAWIDQHAGRLASSTRSAAEIGAAAARLACWLRFRAVLPTLATLGAIGAACLGFLVFAPRLLG